MAEIVRAMNARADALTHRAGGRTMLITLTIRRPTVVAQKPRAQFGL